MSILSSFSSPGHQADVDFANNPAGLAAFLETWNTNLTSWTNIAMTGNPWSSRNDAPRPWYYNPLVTDIPDGTATNPILWSPFPGRLLNFFADPAAPPHFQLTSEQIYQLADTGFWPDGLAALGDIQVPTSQELCPTTNWNGNRQGYTPSGSRGWLDEYCEWSIKRDPDGSIRQIMFTCENPAYYFNLWRHDPQLVTKLYQEHINPNVVESDLYLLDADGAPVHDPVLGYYAYDPTNKWNSGTATLADSGGAMHLTSGPNTLAAEIYLAAAGTIPRLVGNTDAQALICCTWYGRPRRNSDPHIGQLANQTANPATGTGWMLSLSDPVGLYIQSPNTKNWTVPSDPSIDTSTFWQVTRGHVAAAGDTTPGDDSILRAVFTVPAGLTASQIEVYDQHSGQNVPLTAAGLIAQTFLIALRVTAIAPSVAAQTARACVPFSVSMDDPALQPWPVQFLSSVAYNANSVDDSPAYIKPGTTTEMALVVQGGTADASIAFSPPDGISPVNVKQFIGGNPNAPGQTSGGSTQVYIFDLTVDATAPLGARMIHVWNKDRTVFPDQQVDEPGWLIITN